MHIREIPNELVIQGIRELRKAHGPPYDGFGWVQCWDLQPWLSEKLGLDLPENVFRAKMRKMIGKSIIEGCDCGCRGDYEIVWELPVKHGGAFAQCSAYVEELDGPEAARAAYNSVRVP